MSQRASVPCLTLTSLLLASACGSESLSFESVPRGSAGDRVNSPGPAGIAGAGGSGAIGCPAAGFGGAGAGGQAGSSAGGFCGSAGGGEADQGGSSFGGASGSGGAGRAGAGGSSGSGGTAGAGAGGLNGAGGAGAAAFDAYREGGYAGLQNVVGENGESIDGSIAYGACVEAGGVSPFVYDAESCTAGSLCTPFCGSDSDCPVQPGALPSECRASLLGQVCALPCDGPSDCPPGMDCLEDPRFGPSCLFTATPAEAGCDGGCITSDGCGASAACCEGLVCAPWGSCEARQCLDFAWPCPNADLPCCGMLACRDGYCQSP